MNRTTRRLLRPSGDWPADPHPGKYLPFESEAVSFSRSDGSSRGSDAA